MCLCTHIRWHLSKIKRTYEYFDKMFDNQLICNILISGCQGASSTNGTSTCVKTKLVKENKKQEINFSNKCKVIITSFCAILTTWYVVYKTYGFLYVLCMLFFISFLRFILVFRQYDRLSRYNDQLLLHLFNQRFNSCFWLITYSGIIIVRG